MQSVVSRCLIHLLQSSRAFPASSFDLKISLVRTDSMSGRFLTNQNVHCKGLPGDWMHHGLKAVRVLNAKFSWVFPFSRGMKKKNAKFKSSRWVWLCSFIRGGSSKRFDANLSFSTNDLPFNIYFWYKTDPLAPTFCSS